MSSVLVPLITTGLNLLPTIVDGILNIFGNATLIEPNPIPVGGVVPPSILDMINPLYKANPVPLTPEEVATEQVIAGQPGITLEAAFRQILTQKALRESLMMESFVNIKGTSIKLFSTYKFTYVNKPAAEIDNTKASIPQIGNDDYAYIHLVPNTFKLWEKLRQYEFFYVDSVVIKEQINSESTTQTQIAFFPFTRDVTKVPQDEALTAYNKNIPSNKVGGEYAVRNFAPALMEYNADGSFHPTNYEVRPNLPYHSDVLDEYSSNRVEGSKFLSFGTVCFIKSNMGINDVAVQFNVEMSVRAFNQSATYIPPENVSPVPVEQEVYEKKISKISNVIPKRVIKK